MKRILILITMFSLLFGFGSAFGADKKAEAKLKVAVLDIVSRVKGEDIDTMTISELLQKRLVDKKSFIIVDRSYLSKIIEEQKLKLSGMTEDDAAKVGHLAGAQKIVTGSISKMAEKYIMVIKVIDTVSASVDASEQVIVYNLDGIIDSVGGVADKITEKMVGKVDNNGNVVKDNNIVKNVVDSILNNTNNNNNNNNNDDQVYYDTNNVTAEGFTPLQFAIFHPLQLFPDTFLVAGVSVNMCYGQDRTVIGLQTGFVGSITQDLIGVQANVFYNYAKNANILQASCGVNNAQIMSGLQVAPFVNHAIVLYGAQVGIVNTAEKVVGVQIGIVNYTKYMTGVQIGLVNIIEKGWVGFFPFINMCF